MFIAVQPAVTMLHSLSVNYRPPMKKAPPSTRSGRWGPRRDRRSRSPLEASARVEDARVQAGVTGGLVDRADLGACGGVELGGGESGDVIGRGGYGR